MTSVSLNRDRSILATGDARGVIRLWDVIKQRTILTISTHLEPVADMAFSPDGTRLASVGGQAIRVWNAQTGAPIDLLEKPKHLSTSVEHPGWLSRPPTWTINRIAFSPDGRQIVANSQFAIWTWDAHTGKITAQLEEGNTDSVTDLTFNTSQTLMASRSWTKIVVWKLPQGTPAASIDLDTEFYLYHVAFAPGTDELFWHTRYMGLNFFDVRTGDKGKLFADNSVREFAFNPDGTQLAVGLEGEIRIVDPKTMKQISVFPVGKMWVEALAFNLDGRLLAALVGDVVKVWNLSTGKEVAAHSLQSGYVDYTLDFDRQDRVWLVDTHSKKVEPTLEVHTGKTWPRETEGHSFAFTPDGSMKAAVNCEGGIDLIETATGKVLRTFGEVNCGRWEESNSLAFSPDGSILVSGTGAHHLGYIDPDGDGALRFWETATGQEVATLRYSSDIDVIRFSPDGSLIAVGSENHVAAIWAITEKR
jgi:WD40 repeat protein